MTYQLPDLLYLMQRLRDPVDGCPWDKEQTLQSIVKHTLEEVYEVVDTIERNDMPHLKEELGDLLFQIVFYGQIASEQAEFTFGDIISELVTKLIRRHPHVFPTGELTSRAEQQIEAVQVKQNWDAIKQTEKEPQRLLADVPSALPALQRALKLQKKAAKVGFDWPNEQDVIAKLDEELAEFNEAIAEKDHAEQEAEFGDVLFSLVNWARWRGIDPEIALRKTNQKFIDRFNHVERQLEGDFSNATLAQMEAHWQAAKSK